MFNINILSKKKSMSSTHNIGAAIKKILGLLRLDKKDIYAVYLYSIFAGLLSLSLPLGIQSIISFVMAASLSTSIVVLVGLVLVGTFFNGLLQVKQLELIEKVEQKLFVRYTFEFSRRLPHLNIEKLDNYYLPELVNRFFDVPSLQKSLHKLLVDIPAAIFQIILGTVLLSFYHPLFIAFGLVLLAIVILIIRFTSNAGFQTSILTSDYKYQIAAWIQEMARGIKTFKYGHNTNFHIKKADALTKGYLHARTEHFGILKIQYWSLISFKLLITAAMLILGVSLLVNQQINIGQFIASDIVILSIIGSIEKLITNMDQVYEALTAVEKLNKVAQAEIEYSGTYTSNKPEKGFEIEMKNVSYQYPGQDLQLIEHINFSLKPGEWLHICGSSGTGKSTVLRLLTGSFSNFSGQILIDKLPIKNYDVRWLRENSAILLGMQDILDASLGQNISMAYEQSKPKDILAIADLCGLTDFIKSTQLGLDTPVDPVGKRLPAYIKHRVLLCRTLCSGGKLILLDEPFRYLSQDEIRKVTDYLKNEGNTVIIASNENLPEQLFDHTITLT